MGEVGEVDWSIDVNKDGQQCLHFITLYKNEARYGVVSAQL